MKKYLLIILCLLLLVSCKKEETKEEPNNDVAKTTEIEEQKEEYKDDNPIKVGLYLDGKLMNEYTTDTSEWQDIAWFSTYYTNEQSIQDGNTKYTFNRYYQNYDNIDKYKIGYEISFDVGDEHHEDKILDSNIFAFSPYIYVYTYDDVHQLDGAWYSHLNLEDCNENTILSSIKLFKADGITKVTSPITLKVFTYDGEEDFDEEGHYRGISSHTIKINVK